MKIASFFSGAGGMDLGFINAGHEIVFAMDFDKYACQSYSKNIGDIACMNFNDLDASKVPEADVWIGGPPCQDFSIAGKGAGIEGEKGKLINKYVDMIGLRKPRWVVIENVKGLIFKKHRPAFDALIAKLESFGYVVSWKVLNSKDFGVPQNRNRVIIVCGDKEFCFPEGIELDKCVGDIMDDCVDEKFYLSDKAKIKLKDVEKKCPEDVASTVTAGYYKLGWRGNHIKVNKLGFVGNEGVIGQGGLLNRVYDAYGCAPTMITSGGRLIKVGHIGEANSQANRVYNTEGIASTQCGTAGGLGGKTGLYKVKEISPRYREGTEKRMPLSQRVYDGYDGGLSIAVMTGGNPPYKLNERIRRLTPRECARLQGFPEDYEQIVSDTQFYKQMGNAVTVNVAECLARRMK